MSSLKYIDRIKLERFFNMESGYVCNFTDRSFADFIMEITGIDVYSSGYDAGGTSKAKRLRYFWSKESNFLTSKLTKEMAEYWKQEKATFGEGFQPSDQVLYEECIKIAEKIGSENAIEDIEAFNHNSPDKNFSLLSNSIKESIKRGQPEEALDRLHTYITKYVREKCSRHSIKFEKEIPLHSLLGSYVKFLKQNNIIESEMSEKILKSAIGILDSFNFVRNNQTLAHDNSILNYNESVLIFNNISNIIRFIDSIEVKFPEKRQNDPGSLIPWEDMEYNEEDPEIFEKTVDAILEEERKLRIN